MNIQLMQLDKAPDLHKTYLIGTTGSGKSTLINYLMGTELEITKMYNGEYSITFD